MIGKPLPNKIAEQFAYAEANGYDVDRPRFCHIDGI